MNGSVKNSPQKHFATLPSEEQKEFDRFLGSQNFLAEKIDQIVSIFMVNMECGQQIPLIGSKHLPRQNNFQLRLTVVCFGIWKEVQFLKASVNKEPLFVDLL